MKPLKVLEITQSSGGGVQKYVVQLCQHLNRSRFSVTGCCAVQSLRDAENGDVPFPLAFAEAKVPYFMVPMERSISPLKDLLALGTIYREIRNRHFDIVHAHSSKAGVLARIASRWAKVPVVIYSPHAFSFAAPGWGKEQHMYIIFERIAARFGDIIIADSQGERDLAIGHRIADPENITVISPGVPLEDYKPRMAEEHKIQLRASLGINPDSAVIIFVGRLATQKDPVTFIQAAEHLVADMPQVTFLLVGDGPLAEQCIYLIQQGPLHDRMKLLGWRRDYRDLLALSDIAVVSSLFEGLPFILLEAMALSIPVIATAVAGNQDVVVHEKNGLLVSPEAPLEIAERCCWLLQHPDRAKHLSTAARRTVEKRFSMDTMLSLTEQLYISMYQKKSLHHG